MYLDLGIPDYGYGHPVSEAFGVTRVFQSGWKLLTEQPVLALLAGFNLLLLSLLQIVFNIFISTIQIAALGYTQTINPELADAMGSVTDLITTPFFLLLNLLAYAGAYISFAHYIRNDGISYATLYTSIGPAFRALFMGLLQSVIALLVLCLFMIPGVICLCIDPIFGSIVLVLGILMAFIPLIYIGLGFQLSVHALVLDNVGILEAMRLSWRAASGARLHLFLLALCFGTLYLLAYCLCFFPTMFVAAIHMAGMTAGWMAYSRSVEETSTYRFFRNHIERE